MRHCIGSHEILFAVNSYRDPSILDQCDQRLAPISLVLDQYGWDLDQIKSLENANVYFQEDTIAAASARKPSGSTSSSISKRENCSTIQNTL